MEHWLKCVKIVFQSICSAGFSCFPSVFIAGDVLLKPIIACGGKDISYWFDKKTKDVRECCFK